MTVHEEFLEMLRVLKEAPPFAGKETPVAERDENDGKASGKVQEEKNCADDNCLGAAS